MYRSDDRTVYVDCDFPDLISVPSSLFMDVNSSNLVAQGALIFQDKASTCAVNFLKDRFKLESMNVIEARAGCGKFCKNLMTRNKNSPTLICNWE